MLALLLALAWAPLTAHCQIEQVTGLTLLRCSPADVGGPSDGSPCNSAVCCAWESGLYHLPAGRPVVAVPLMALVPLVTTLVENWTPADSGEAVVTESAPGPLRPWQFSYRAALPPRAPSIAS